MAGYNFSVRWLLVVVTLTCLCLALIVKPTVLGTSLAIALTRIVLCTAVVLAVMLTGRKRAFWFGFALAGWAEFLNVFPFLLQNEMVLWSRYSLLSVMLTYSSSWEGILDEAAVYPTSVVIKTLFSLLCGLAAGCLCQWIYDRRFRAGGGEKKS